MSELYPLEQILLPMGGTTVKDADKMEELWESDEYIAEEKYDGSRYLSVGGRFFSRKVSVKTNFPVEKTENVPHLVELLKAYPLLILDGEVYIEGAKSNDVVSIMGAGRDKALWRQGFGEYIPPFLQFNIGGWRSDPDSEWVDVPKKEVVYLAERESLKPVQYVVYDILRDADGNWLTDLPWIDRRGILEEQMEIVFTDNVHASDSIKVSNYVQENKKDFNKEIMLRGGEGTMLKNINGAYHPDKKPRWNWIKVKQEITSDVIITGFKDAKREYDPERPELIETWQYWENLDKTNNNPVVEIKGSLDKMFGLDEFGTVKFVRRIMTMDTKEFPNFEPVTKFHYMGWIGSVLFSQYDDKGELVEVGYCSGIKEELRKDMTDNKDKYLGECMEISAMERTKDNYFRHPQYLRMRPDKNQKDCVIGVD